MTDNKKIKSFALLALATILLLPLAISQVEFPMRIDDAKTLDEEGRAKNTFKRGELVLVEARVVCPFKFYAPPEYRFLYIVKFVDSQGTTFYYGVIYGVLQPGKNATYVVGGKIPENAPTGTYKAYIYVWSNWPAYEFPTAYAKEANVTFTVTAQP